MGWKEEELWKQYRRLRNTVPVSETMIKGPQQEALPTTNGKGCGTQCASEYKAAL